MTLPEMIIEIRNSGYSEEYAEAKLCQDILLKALAESSISRNVTIKGGVVMRSITGNTRRATQDIDIDFIKYSLSERSIENFIRVLNCLPDLEIKMNGKIEELRQQEYQGKRVYVIISDKENNSISSKIDLGVHNNLNIKQEEYCFDISIQDDAVSLLINSKEQIFTEKLKSLLKFGTFSTRYKDVFDIHYLSSCVDTGNLKDCIDEYILRDHKMHEKNMNDILKRVERVFSDKDYRTKLTASNRNWQDANIDDVLDGTLSFLKSIVHISVTSGQ